MWSALEIGAISKIDRKRGAVEDLILSVKPSSKNGLAVAFLDDCTRFFVSQLTGTGQGQPQRTNALFG